MRFSRAPHFRGTFTLPGDKSISHRLALLGALAEGPTRIGNFSTAADCSSTLTCLERLGVSIRRDAGDIGIDGRGPEGLREPREPLDAGNSGSTLRMLAGLVAGRPFESVLTGDGSLRQRPVERVAEPLRAMGAQAITTGGKPPLTIRGGHISGISWRMPVASAQVKTAILLAGLQARGTTSVQEPLPSRDHTERLLPLFGARLLRDGPALRLEEGARLKGIEMRVPGDVSSAAFLILAALLLPGSEVRLQGLVLNPHRTAFIDVLRRMGGQIETGTEQTEPEPVGWISARSSKLRGVRVPASLVPRLIDEVPALAVAAAHAEGAFSIEGASELRVKESDRIAALAEGLLRLGVDAEERPDGLVVRGGRPLRGARVRSHGDHRIAMALTIAALTAEGETEIDDAECASVSFPEFYPLIAGATR